MDIVHGQYPWTLSVDTVHGRPLMAPMGSLMVPMGSLMARQGALGDVQGSLMARQGSLMAVEGLEMSVRGSVFTFPQVVRSFHVFEF